MKKPRHHRPRDEAVAQDSAPPERWQHGAAYGATYGVQHVASPVMALRKSGKIGDAAVLAADRYYRDYAFAAGARDPEATGSGGGVDGYSIAQIMAIGAYRDAAQAVGIISNGILMAVVVMEISLATMAGGRSGAARARVTGDVVKALTALADHYAEKDGSRPGRSTPIRAASVDRDAT